MCEGPKGHSPVKYLQTNCGWNIYEEKEEKWGKSKPMQLQVPSEDVVLSRADGSLDEGTAAGDSVAPALCICRYISRQHKPLNWRRADYKISLCRVNVKDLIWIHLFFFQPFTYSNAPSYRQLADGYSKRANFDSVRHRSHNEGSNNAPVRLRISY